MDASHGAIVAPGGINIDGGSENDTVQIVKPEGEGAVIWDSDILNGADPESAGHDLTVVDAWGQSDDQAVRWTNVETADDTVSVTAGVDALRDAYFRHTGGRS